MVGHKTASVGDRIVAEEFNAFKRRLIFDNTDEELDRVAQQIGCRSVAELRRMAVFILFMRDIDRRARWN